MKKIYITAGHQVINGKGTGAHGFNDEAKLALELRDDLTAKLRQRGLTVLNEAPADPLTKVITWLRNTVTRDTDICVDIHFNAGPPKAEGTEVIIPEKYTEKELQLARNLASAISTTLGTKLRKGCIIHLGVKTESETQHKSIGILNKPFRATNVLLEVCFVTNYHEMTILYPTNYRALVKNLADVLSQA